MRICKNMCKFNPNNHYYFNDSLQIFKSYKIKSEPDRTFNTSSDDKIKAYISKYINIKILQI